ncbi:MAG: DUF5697 family protein [Clostridia bacterium]|nr:DUF5697 family protein [Clostridia bacterium]
MYNYQDKELKIINFIQDFGCCTKEQLEKLFDCNNNMIKNILHNNFISKKGNIIVHKQKSIDEKVIASIDVLCEYKNRYKSFYKNFYPISLTFLSKDNLVYYIIVTEKEDEKGIIKIIKNKPANWSCDKLILLFKDDEMIDKIESDIPYLYCTYPGVEVLSSVT